MQVLLPAKLRGLYWGRFRWGQGYAGMVRILDIRPPVPRINELEAALNPERWKQYERE